MRTIAAQCGQLIREKKYHKEQALYYHKMFNASVPKEDLSADIIILHELTPLQEFWQQMAQHHITALHLVENQINAL
jgi:hypothetical protein